MSAVASATTVVGSTTLFDPKQAFTNGYCYTANANFVNTPTTGKVQINFWTLWGQFGRQFSQPQDWSQVNGLQVTLQNHQNFEVSMGFRVYTTAALDKYFQSDFTLAPKQTLQFFVDRSNFDSAGVGMMFPPPVFQTPFVRILPSHESPTPQVYKWMFYYRGALPASVGISAINGLTVTNNDLNGIVDTYGQYTQRTWPEKVDADSDFAKSMADEDADLANNPGPGETDGSHSLPPQQPTGKWHVVKLSSGKFYFVHPNGRLFWTFGMCSVGSSQPTVTQGREYMFTNLPAQAGPFGQFYGTSGGKTTFDLYRANLYRKYGDTFATDWAVRANRRLQSWGFNTVGAGHDVLMHQMSNIPYASVLLTSSYPKQIHPPFAFWGSLPDAFASDFQSWMVSTWSSTLAKLNGDTNFMGVYVDSEQSWGAYGDNNATYQLPLAVLNCPISEPAKAAFISQLQAKYGSIILFNLAWGTNFASWSAMGPAFDLSQTPLLATAVPDCSKFLSSFATQYYQKIRAALTQLNCTGLYLGSRNVWDWTPSEIYASEEPFVDVHSLDYYGAAYEVPWQTFDGWQKPTLIGEFAFGTKDRGSFSGGFVPDMDCNDQNDRANRTTDYLKTAATQKKVIGAHWYLYIDMPIVGSLQDQQNLGIGAVDVTDQPYYPLINTFRNFAANLYGLRGQ